MATQKKILIIDDDEDVQFFLQEFLKLHGYQILFADNGERGFNTAKKDKPDLILLDISMPKEDGFAAQNQLKEDPATKNIPIIFISGQYGGDRTTRALSGGAKAFMEKPFDLQKLLKEIEAILKPGPKN